jgi:hypothetical protein
MLSRRAVVQGIIETAYGDATPVGTNDGILVAEPMYTLDPNLLERDIATPDLSPEANIVGRLLAEMTFRTEMRSNGKSHLGTLVDAPMISRLFRACGYAITASPASSMYGVFDHGVHINPATWVTGGSLTNTAVICYFLEVTTAGVSGVAQVTVTSETLGEGTAAAAITTATPISLGTSGGTITPTFTGSLALGQKWTVWALPPGLRMDPISDDFESIHLVMNKDGVVHSMPGSFGTFEITAEAGNYASIAWTFRGKYTNPVDLALPTPLYERTLPAQVELARLRIDSFYAIVQQVTYTQNNEISIRPDVSSPQGYIGTRITSRNPEGGINPEAELVATQDFWGKFAASDRMSYQMRVGTLDGNTVWTFAPGVQYTGMTYADREGILNLDAGLKFPRYRGNDEVMFFFC